VGRKAQDLTGQIFYQLTALYRDGSDEHSKPMWICECSCGNKTRVKGNYLKIGKTKSCGCRTTRTHGLSKHPLHGIRNAMKMRCYNPKTRSYTAYGAKGIKICEEWLNDFEAFFKWCMENGWKRGLTIDRIDSSEDYGPSNCRFISRSENSSRRKI